MEQHTGAAFIDPNLRVETEIHVPDLIWLDVKQAPFHLYGLHYGQQEKCYLRMPHDAIVKIGNAGMESLNHHTAGGRVRFCTDSPVIAICAVMDHEQPMPHLSLMGLSGFDLYRETNGKQQFVHAFIPSPGMKEGYSSLYDVRASDPDTTIVPECEYTLNFPSYDRVKELYIGIKKSAVMRQAKPYRFEKPVVYYGSSITQGACASRPGNSYQNYLSRKLDTDYINLGFSGSAKGEAETASYIAGLDMSMFVCDYDHNADSPEHLRNTHLSFLRIIRKAQPLLPVLVVSAPDVLLHPGRFEERRNIIRRNVEIMQEEGDRLIRFLDGKTLYQGEDWDSCTVDGCHPNDFGFRQIAIRMEPFLRQVLLP